MISPLLCLVVLPIAGAILMIAGTQARNTAVRINAKLPGESDHLGHAHRRLPVRQLLSGGSVSGHSLHAGSGWIERRRSPDVNGGNPGGGLCRADASEERKLVLCQSA